MHRECRERYPRHRGLAIPTSITARAWLTCCDACRDRQLTVSFEVLGGENIPGIPGAYKNLQFYVSGNKPMFPSRQYIFTIDCLPMSEDHHRPVLFLLLCMRHLYIAIMDHIAYQTYGYFWYSVAVWNQTDFKLISWPIVIHFSCLMATRPWLILRLDRDDVKIPNTLTKQWPRWPKVYC